MRIANLFAGTGTWSRPWEDRGHTAWKTDFVAYDGITHVGDILDLPLSLIPKSDVILASPDCTAFSVASLGHHWGGGHRAYEPKTDKAHNRMALVHHAVAIAEALVARDGLSLGVFENPRGMLRKLGLLDRYERRTVTYCQYGDTRMKPTDLWGVPSFPEAWEPRDRCSNGDPCHVAAPRGSKTPGSTQGTSKVERSFMPYELSLEICLAAEAELGRASGAWLEPCSPEGFVYYRSLVPADRQHFLTPYTAQSIRERGMQPYLWTGVGREAVGLLMDTDHTLLNVFRVGAWRGAGADAVEFAVFALGARRVEYFNTIALREIYNEWFVPTERVPFDLEIIRRDFPDYDPDVLGTPELIVAERRAR